MLAAAGKCGGYDIYILDVIMPQLNGIELGMNLREEGFDGKIIYLTSSQEYSLDAFRVRAFDYLIKPITKDAFHKTVAEAIAIENSTNACMKLPEAERSIEIKVICKPKFIIMVRNTFDGNVVFDEQGIPVSGEEGHGFGTRTIAALCEKVGGFCDFQAEGNTFTLFMHLK